MIKKLLAFIIVVSFTFFVLPVKSYAAAAGAGIIIGGTAYAAGTYTFATLPPTVQGIMNSTAKDYQNQLFPSKSSIILLDKGNSIGGGGNNNKQPVTPPTLSAYVTTLILEATYQIVEHGDEAYEFYCDWLGDVFSDYETPPSESELALAQDIVQKCVDRVNETEFGNKPLSVEEFTEKSGYDYKSFLDNHGLVDNGKPFLSGLREANPYIQEIKIFDYNNFYYYVDTSSCPSYSSNANLTHYGFYYLKDNKLTSLNNGWLVSSNSCVEYKIGNDRFFYRFNGEGNWYSMHGFSNPLPEQIFLITYKPCLYNEGVEQDKLTLNYTVLPDDLTEVPGVNPNNLTDVEKAALGLASHLGVDIGVIGTQFRLVVDENGNKYMEQISTGIRYAVEEFLEAFNQSVKGDEAVLDALEKLLDNLNSQAEYNSGIATLLGSVEGYLASISANDEDRKKFYEDLSGAIDDWKNQITRVNDNLEKNNEELNNRLREINTSLSRLDELVDIVATEKAEKTDFEKFQKELAKLIVAGKGISFPLYDQCVQIISTAFNYDDQLTAPNFDFYFDSDNNGTSEQYKLIDLSVLDYELNNSHMVDKSIFATPIKVITFIRYILCAVTYGLFAIRLMKRLPDFYGSSPWFLYPNFKF